MRKSIRVITKKRRGRPVTTGKGTLVGVRLLDAPLAALDDWISDQKEPDLSRPEAIRRLVEIGLGRARPIERPAAAKTRSVSAERAKELAEKTIERLADPETPSEEKVVRRRRLVKGPSEFREDRIDQPRPKKR
jgi:hypothetical protein